MDRALKAIIRFCRVAQDSGVDRLDAFATSAVRDATNGDELVTAIHSMTGCEVNLLDGETEALLSAEALQRGLHVEDGIVADLGGGSLELAVLRRGKTREMVSLPLGTMRLQAQTEGNMELMRKQASKALDRIEWIGAYKGKVLFPIGGVWRAFARLKIGDSNYPLDIIHGYSITPGSAAETATLLTGLSKKSLIGLESVVRQRRLSMPLSGLLLNELIDRIQPDEITFSAVGVREGYVYKNMPADRIANDPLLSAAAALAGRDGRYGDSSDSMLDWLRPVISAENQQRQRLQFAVCALSDIAWREHPDYRAPFAFERVIQYPFFGITHTERAFIALAVYLRYGGRPGDARIVRIGNLLSKRAVRRAETLGYGLRLAYRVSAGNPELLDRSRLVVKNDRLSLVLPGAGAAPDRDRIRRSFERLCRSRRINIGTISTAN